jgi:hypothetical protein
MRKASTLDEEMMDLIRILIALTIIGNRVKQELASMSQQYIILA